MSEPCDLLRDSSYLWSEFIGFSSGTYVRRFELIAHNYAIFQQYTSGLALHCMYVSLPDIFVLAYLSVGLAANRAPMKLLNRQERLEFTPCDGSSRRRSMCNLRRRRRRRRQATKTIAATKRSRTKQGYTE